MKEITVTELSAIEDALVIDVREKYEYDAGHAPGVTLIPLGELEAAQANISRTRPVHVICASGGRSVVATNYLESQGIDAINVIGGTSAWQRAGLPIITKD